MKAGRILQGSVRYEAPVHIVSPRLLFGNRIRGNNIAFLMLCRILTLGQSEVQTSAQHSLDLGLVYHQSPRFLYNLPVIFTVSSLLIRVKFRLHRTLFWNRQQHKLISTIVLKFIHLNKRYFLVSYVTILYLFLNYYLNSILYCITSSSSAPGKEVSPHGETPCLSQ